MSSTSPSKHRHHPVELLKERAAELETINEQLRTEIAERKRAEEALRESEGRLSSFLDSATDGFMLFDSELNLIRINKAALHMLGVTERDVIGKNLLRIAPDAKSKGRYGKYMEVMRTGKPLFIDDVVPHPKFRHRHIAVKAFKVDGGLGIIGTDITERKRAEEKIKASLKEKEVLLKEIHHRVKNNLQVVSSLLYLQSEHIKDEQSLATIKESRNRVKSMALVHEQLYQSKGLARVDFIEYIRNLTTYLFRSYGVDPDAITLKINADDVSLGIDTAIPCGLIINELVSNSLEYAFPAGKARGDRESEICINLHAYDNKLTLTVSDNGVGLPGDLDFQNTESFGLHLVNTLTRQLEGSIELDRSGGTAFEITFAEPQRY